MKDQKKSHLVVLFLTVFLYLVGFGVIIPILPALSRDFGASPTEVGILMSLYSLMQFLFAPFWGSLSDRIGRRPILVGCLLGEALSYVLFAYADSLNTLYFARIMAGFFGASLSTASASISDVTGPQERSKGMALIGAAFGLGFVVGPALGGYLTYLGGVRLTLLTVAGLCFATFVFGFFFLKESLNPENVNREKRSGRFRRFLELRGEPILGFLVLTFFLSVFGMAAMESTLVLFVGDLLNWSIVEVSYGFAYIGVLSTLNQGVIVRRLLPKLGERKLLVIGLLLMSLSFICVAVAYFFDGRNAVAILGLSMTILSFGTSFTNPSVMGSVSILVPMNRQGEALGTAQSAASLGRILGPLAGGALYQRVHMISPFLLSSLACLVAFAIMMRYWTKLPSSAQSAGG